MMSFERHKVSEENQLYFESVCKELREGSTLFEYFYGQKVECVRKSEREHTKMPRKTKQCVRDIDEPVTKVSHQCVQTVQNNFLTTYVCDGDMVRVVAGMNPSEVLGDSTLVVQDSVFVTCLEKSPDFNKDSVVIFMKIVLLPKLNSCAVNVSESVRTHLQFLFETHEEDFVDNVLLPLTSSDPENVHGTSNLLQGLVTDRIQHSTFVKLLRSLSDNPSLEEKNLDFFSHMLEFMDPTDENSQRAVIEFLGKHSNSFTKSIKFGRCILRAIQKFGAKIPAKDAFGIIVTSHKSGMRKTIEIQLRKI